VNITRAVSKAKTFTPGFNYLKPGVFMGNAYNVEFFVCYRSAVFRETWVGDATPSVSLKLRRIPYRKRKLHKPNAAGITHK
jgi:hypothetical protein